MRVMKVVTYAFDNIDKDLWDALEDNAEHLNVFQTYSWAETLNSIGTEPLFFILSDQNGPLAGLLMFKSRFIWGAFHSYEAIRGPLVVSDANEELFSSFASGLKDVVKKKRGFSFYWTPSPLLNHKQCFIQQGFHPIPRATFVINLKLSIETLWGNLEGRARWTIKKAKRNEVEVIEAKDWLDWDKFHKLYVNEGFKTPLPPHSVRLHKAIHEHLMSKKQAKLFIAKHEKKMIAGIVFLLTKDEMVGYRGASDARYLKLSGTGAIHWHAICWAEEQGIKYYDMGGTLWEPDKKHYLYGVHQFKRQFGGKLCRYYGFALNKFYIAGRNLFFGSSKARRLYSLLEKFHAIQRTDRI